MSGVLQALLGGGGVSGSTWDPANKGSNITLSSQNTIANGNGTVATVAGTKSIATSTSKYYFTVTVVGTPSSLGSGGGIGTGVGTNSTYVGSQSSTYGFNVQGSFWTIQGNGGALSSPVAPPAVGDVLNVAVDASGASISVYLGINGNYYDSTGAAAGTTPTTATFTGLATGQLPFGSAKGASENVTINTTPGSIPAGYVALG